MRAVDVFPQQLAGPEAVELIQERLSAMGSEIRVRPLDGLPAPTIVFNSHKGGVGKTTVTSLLAWSLASRGYRVLIVDFDSQCNVSTACGFAMRGADKGLYNVDHVMSEMVAGSAAATIEAVRWTVLKQEAVGRAPIEVRDPVAELIDIVPGCPTLDDRTGDMTKADARFRLNAGLRGVRENYHFVLIDTGPAIGFLAECAWASADHVLGVTPLYYFEIEGTVNARNKILTYRDVLGRPNLDMRGAIVNEYVPKRSVQSQQLAELLSVFGEERVWVDEAVPDTEAIKRIMTNSWSFSRLPAGDGRRVLAAADKLTRKFLEVCSARTA